MDKRRILIIDDDRNNINSTGDFLRQEGFEVSAAENGAEGLKKLHEVNPEIVLLDLVLPGESGFKIAHQIREIPRYKHLPIIAISLKREEVDKHIAAKSGIAGYIEKPIDYNKLLFFIQEILR
ncbi:MAG: response regulator [Candidatus Omnitrophica bacterium]|nr:response regulator [Candidatus Omnitrophota bacterium]